MVTKTAKGNNHVISNWDKYSDRELLNLCVQAYRLLPKEYREKCETCLEYNYHHTNKVENCYNLKQGIEPYITKEEFTGMCVLLGIKVKVLTTGKGNKYTVASLKRGN